MSPRLPLLLFFLLQRGGYRTFPPTRLWVFRCPRLYNCSHFCFMSTAFINPSTFFASSNFHTRLTIPRARSSPIVGETSAKNFFSTSESFNRFFACPNG